MAESKAEDEVAGEVDQIQSLQSKLDEAKEKFLRAKAEYENYRKRIQREFGEVRNQVKLATIQEFLPVFDHFQMATEHTDKNADVETLKKGMDMISVEFKRTLDNLGVIAVDTVGQTFNPEEHEAMAEEASEDVPANQVLRQWRCGYRMGDRLIRPATVVVSSGSTEVPQGEQASEDK